MLIANYFERKIRTVIGKCISFQQDMCRSYEAESFGKEQIYVLQPQLYNRLHRITDTLNKGGNGSDLCLGRTLWLSGKRLVMKNPEVKSAGSPCRCMHQGNEDDQSFSPSVWAVSESRRKEPPNASHLVEYWDYRVADKKVEKTHIKLIYI